MGPHDLNITPEPLEERTRIDAQERAEVRDDYYVLTPDGRVTGPLTQTRARELAAWPGRKLLKVIADWET
jgi:hypothetical protein